MTQQLTIRLDDALAREIEDLARQDRVSRQEAALRLLRKGAGVEERAEEEGVIGSSLDWFFGSWTEEQAREFDEAFAWTSPDG